MKKEAAYDSDSESDEEMNEEVYMQRNMSCESVDDDDLYGDLNMSDDEDMQVQRKVMKKEKKKERKQRGEKGKANKHHVEVDTNVFQVNLDSLKTNTELATGDAEACKGC